MIGKVFVLLFLLTYLGLYILSTEHRDSTPSVESNGEGLMPYPKRKRYDI